ncbi:MAG: VWA domain-containing protein, partial [Nanoarchaeota archaeon]|nr:VWA domain-containing protein [Nanoarchaeota archaeon]
MFKKSSTGLAKMSSLFVILVLLTSIFTIYTPLTSSTVVPTADMWTTDIDGTPKLDFRPEETVYIHGAGFPAESFFDIVVIRPDGTIVDGSAGFDPVCNEEGPLLDGCYDTVLSDYDGSFIYQYILNGIYGTYHVNAFDDQGIVVSSMTFTDHTWSDVDINGGDVTTGFLDVTLSIAWSGEGGDPTQMRFVNVEPGTACTTLPITVWPAWEPIATEKPWTLLPGDAGYRKVCMQTAHGILGTPDRLKQADDSILYFIVEPNPELEQSCGLDMVLVIDSSGSINSSELGQMKDAYEDFVTAFLPATPTLIGVVDFDTTASVIQTFTDDVPTLITAVNTPTSGGYTNWQDALVKAHGMFDPRDNHPDLIVFASDGNPNRQGNPAVTVTEQEAVQAAVVEANSIKSDGIRIIALGIGTDLDADNLRAISSHDALITSDFGDLAQDLADLALELCGGTITVRKLVDGVGVPDWEYMADVVGGTPSPLSGYTDQDGYITFDIDISDTTADVDVIETLQGGYSLDSASCVRRDQTSIGTFDGFDSVDGITIGLNNIISCEFNNIVEASCGDGEINQQSEQCDDNGANTDTPCTPGYESSCTYC